MNKSIMLIFAYNSDRSMHHIIV